MPKRQFCFIVNILIKRWSIGFWGDTMEAFYFKNRGLSRYPSCVVWHGSSGKVGPWRTQGYIPIIPGQPGIITSICTWLNPYRHGWHFPGTFFWPSTNPRGTSAQIKSGTKTTLMFASSLVTESKTRHQPKWSMIFHWIDNWPCRFLISKWTLQIEHLFFSQGWCRFWILPGIPTTIRWCHTVFNESNFEHPLVIHGNGKFLINWDLNGTRCLSGACSNAMFDYHRVTTVLKQSHMIDK